MDFRQFRFTEQDIPPQPPVIDDGADSWWSGAFQSGARRAIVASTATVAVAVGAVLANMPADEIGFPPGHPDEDAWVAPRPADVKPTLLQQFAFDAGELGTLHGTVDDEDVFVPFEGSPPYVTIALPFSWDEGNDLPPAIAALAVTDDPWSPESLYRRAFIPKVWTPDLWSFEQNEQAAGLFGALDDEAFPQVPVAPLVAPIQPPIWALIQGDELPGVSPIAGDEGEWNVVTPPWPAPRLALVLGLTSTEDQWVPEVRVVAPPQPHLLLFTVVTTTLTYVADDGVEMSQPLIFTEGQTGDIIVTCRGIDGTVEDLSTAQSVTFRLKNVVTGAVKADAVSLSGGTSSGTAIWTRQASEVDTPGDYLSQVKVVRSDGTVAYYPDSKGVGHRSGSPVTILAAV